MLRRRWLSGAGLEYLHPGGFKTRFRRQIMARVIHFDISGENPGQLVPFYEGIFGWKFNKWQGPMEYWLIETGPENEAGINGGLTRRQTDDRVVNTIGVQDIDATLEQVRAKGGTVIAEKDAIPGMGWFAQFRDPEGNVFGVMQEDPSAK
jgi:predicted enzyme related to lactoylglutathione lyase